MANAEILATTLGTENTYGTVAGRTPAGPFSYARITTEDKTGRIRAYVGDGEFVDDELTTFGSSRGSSRAGIAGSATLYLQKWL